MVSSDQSYARLPKSYKNLFPFRICAPSFIYPAHWITNIRLLGPYLDEIEILCFDSGREADFPSKDDIDQMAKLADKHAISFNMHLPIDISPGSPDSDIRRGAIDIIMRTYRLAAPLNPTACIFHLPLDVTTTDQTELNCWRQRLEKSIETLLLEGIPSQSLSVETLDYPLEWIRPIIETFDLTVCLDVGHLLDHGIDWQAEYCKWANRINMVHLHGVQNHHDHRCLDLLSQSVFTGILATLKSFTGTISIEVFSFDDLKRSLAYFERHWHGQESHGKTFEHCRI